MGKLAQLVILHGAVIQMRGSSCLMKNAGSSLPSTHLRSKRISVMIPFFGKPLRIGFPKYTDNTAIHTHARTHVQLLQVSVDCFLYNRPGGIMFLTSQSLEPAQVKVDLGKKVEKSLACLVLLLTIKLHLGPGLLCSLFIPTILVTALLSFPSPRNACFLTMLYYGAL